jgi:molybdopterin molybdotransferase
MDEQSASPTTLIDDCFRRDPRDGARYSHAQAIAALRAAVSPTVATESVVLGRASGRICAAPVTACRPVPGHTNAAVDGYAIAAAHYDTARGNRFKIAGRAAAGRPFDGAVAPGDAVRIFTGAVVPANLDTVVMQEDCSVVGEEVSVPPGLKRGANVRRAGEDVGLGDVLIETGQRLRAQDIAALASSGYASVRCFRPVRVGIASTGDEVVQVGEGETISEGQVFDVNSPMLQALVTRSGGEVVDLGLWPDKRETVRTRLREAAERCDVIITSGGASQGEEDHIAHVLAEIGHRHFWQIAVKPGRPLMLGQVGTTVAIGLPGNPVAVFVCFLLYVKPLIDRLGGGNWFEPRRFPLPAAFEIKDRKLGRREFWRGTTIETENGLAVEKFARDGSGLISGLRAADGLIDVPEDRPAVARGELVDFIPFSEFGVA